MKTFIVEADVSSRSCVFGCMMVEAWTMKGARRKYRKQLHADGIPDPELLTLDVCEVAAPTWDTEAGPVILDREIYP